MENETQVNFYFGIITLTLAFIIITGGLVLALLRYQKKLHTKQQQLLLLDARHKKELLQNSIDSAETERRQLAKDIHDEIGSIFSTLSLSVNQLAANAEHPMVAIETSKNLVQSGIDSVRRISHAIIPAELELLGLEQTIENYLITIENVSGIKTLFSFTVPLHYLSQNTTLALYRIVQELGANCMKYSFAKKMHLEIYPLANSIVLSYTDDGVGAEPGKKIGIGLKNIESRAVVLDGHVKFTTQPGNGFACLVTIPLINNSIL